MSATSPSSPKEIIEKTAIKVRVIPYDELEFLAVQDHLRRHPDETLENILLRPLGKIVLSYVRHRLTPYENLIQLLRSFGVASNENLALLKERVIRESIKAYPVLADAGELQLLDINRSVSDPAHLGGCRIGLKFNQRLYLHLDANIPEKKRESTALRLAKALAKKRQADWFSSSVTVFVSGTNCYFFKEHKEEKLRIYYTG